MKELAVDDLLRWAYRVELPKEPMASRGAHFLRRASHMASWAALSKSAELGTEVDEPDLRNRFGLFPDKLATSEPHDDALRVYFAVRSLEENFTVDLPDTWDPVSDVSGAIDNPSVLVAARAEGIERIFFHMTAQPHVTVRLARQGAASAATARVTRPLPEAQRRLGLRRSVVDLLKTRAVLGGTPGWEFGPVRKLVVRHTNGKPRWFRMVDGVELDGFDPKARRPTWDAYPKFQYDPNPADVVEARAEYWLWFTALTAVYRLLRGTLDAHSVLPPSVPAMPWAPGVRAPKTFVAA